MRSPGEDGGGAEAGDRRGLLAARNAERGAGQLVLQPWFVIMGVERVGGSDIRGLGLDVVGAIVTRRAVC